MYNVEYTGNATRVQGNFVGPFRIVCFYVEERPLTADAGGLRR